MLRFRSLLLWLMLLALPLQGWAAASMMFCGMAGNPEAVQMQQATGAHHPHAEHSHHAATQSGHLQVDGGTALDKHGPTDAPAPLGSLESDAANQLPGAAHQCSVCATCCSLAALSTHQAGLHNHAVPSMAFAEPPALSYSVPPRLLERPPRA